VRQPLSLSASRWRCSLHPAREKTTLPDSSALSEFFDRLSINSASALLLDYDGTLAPFQMERDRAFPYPDVMPLLESIVQRGKTRVVVISGRPVAELKRLLYPLNHLEMWGTHGLERVLPDGTHRQSNVSQEALASLSLAKERISEAGLIPLAEFKPGGIAIHWRGMDEAQIAQVEASLRECWAELAEHTGLKLLKFESGVELRVVHPDKGDAVNTIISESGPDDPIAYLGDDITDEDSFRALNDRGLSVLVRPQYRETSAKVRLKPPHELVAFLEQWLLGIS
jgi:trehalose 6-phosphate phosphatase